VSAPRENVLIVPNRNVLSTGSGRRGGRTRSPHHDSAGARPAGSAEKGTEETDHAAVGRQRTGCERTSSEALADSIEGGRQPGSVHGLRGRASNRRLSEKDAGKSTENPIARRVPGNSDRLEKRASACACHVGGRAFERRRPRQVSDFDCRELEETPPLPACCWTPASRPARSRYSACKQCVGGWLPNILRAWTLTLPRRRCVTGSPNSPFTSRK